MSSKSYAFLALFFCLAFPALVSSLNFGYYYQTCPSAEDIVRQEVFKAVTKNPGLAAGLIRLHFHDCFVRGCDASVLLDPIPGIPSERDHPANNGSLRGFEVIDAAKKRLEALCPQKVSCSDILAFAARDSAYKVGRIWYSIPGGRRDGRVSNLTEVTQNLPPPFFNATQLKDNFAKKGFSLDEMVTLSGAHSIGVAHCTSFNARLYPTQDPTMDPSYAAFLKTICPAPVANVTGPNPAVNQDPLSPNTLDNKYYADLKAKRGLLISDQTLFDSPLTTKIVVNNARYGSIWANKFEAAMVKMGNLNVLSGRQGEVRKNCRLVN